MTFKTVSVPSFYYIADQIGIVDQAVWSKVSNPVTYPDKNPVGTGAYTTGSSSCTPQNIKYTANPHYWQPGLPKVATVNYPSFLTNDTANTYLANGQAQWGSQFIPSIQSFYLAKNPNYHYWFPPVANVSVFINLTNPLLKNVAVRQAMAYAIDRHKASTIGEYGYEPPSNQTGIVTPTFGTWLNTTQASAYGGNYAYDPAKAMSILQNAGFKKNSSGIFVSPSGQPLSFTILDNGGFSDWVAAVQTIQASLKAVGIQVTPVNLAATTYQSNLYTGKYQLAYGSETGGPDAVLRAAAAAVLGQLRADRDRRGIQLRAVQQPGHGRDHQPVRHHHRSGHPALDRGPAAEGDAGGRPGDPGHRVGRLVPVRHRQLQRMGHPGQPVRAARRVQLPGLGHPDAPPGSEVSRQPDFGASRPDGMPQGHWLRRRRVLARPKPAREVRRTTPMGDRRTA